jgi:hypothetical protein
MTITLQELRTFAQRQASPDPVSTDSDVKITTWITQALRRLYAEHEWSEFITEGRITMVPEETGSKLNLTQGSGNLTLTDGETFESKYVSERWALHIDGESRMAFELTSQASTTAVLRDGEIWVQATSTGNTYAFTRHIYPLPGDATKVYLVEELQSAYKLRPMNPREFDRARAQTPTQRGSSPTIYTVRNGNIEFWPAPGEGYEVVSFTYLKTPDVDWNQATSGSTTVEWPMRMLNLLEAAIVLQASIMLDDAATVPYVIAIKEYERLLKLHRAQESGISNLGGPMTLGNGGRAVGYQGYAGFPETLSEVG